MQDKVMELIIVSLIQSDSHGSVMMTSVNYKVTDVVSHIV
jgi:hypothetical protein